VSKLYGSLAAVTITGVRETHVAPGRVALLEQRELKRWTSSSHRVYKHIPVRRFEKKKKKHDPLAALNVAVSYYPDRFEDVLFK